ncbi:hypothetical protein D9M68_932710 [compost metagenome]
MNHAVPYLESVLRFIGITNLETIYVEGLALGTDSAEKAVASARGRIGRLAIAA